MRFYVIYVQEQKIGSRTFIREAEKYGRRKTDRDSPATAGKKRGGRAVKFTSPGLDGVPDRLVLMPGGRCAFVELKAPGKSCVLCRRKGEHNWKPWAFRFTA